MWISRVGCLGVILLLLANPATAACSGSGLAYFCTAGTTSSEVQSAINAASDGAVITFAAGSYNWGSAWISFSNSKGATLICASQGACTVATSGTALGMNTMSGTNSKPYRISGFNFTGGGGTYMIWFTGNHGSLTNLRIDHNTFSNLDEGTIAILLGSADVTQYFYGVIDHNTVTAAKTVMFLYMLSLSESNPPPSPFGTANNMFVEDNTITITNMTNAGMGCNDGWGGLALVWRYNTMTNCLTGTHGTTSMAGGPASVEFYNNQIRVTANAIGFQDCYRCFHWQGGGEFIAFNNVFTAYSGKSTNVIEGTHYRSGTPGELSYSTPPGQCDGTKSIDGNRSPTTTYRGYPCWRQSGRDFAGNLKPMYAWNNRWSDNNGKVDLVLQQVGIQTNYFSNHFVANRDYYNAVSASAQSSPSSPFNGSTGMGFGTLANRPATCTTNSAESGGGVGYFATDQGPKGTLYRCSAPNTWTVHYTPYTYPHPMTTGTAGGPPNPPSMLSANVQ